MNRDKRDPGLQSKVFYAFGIPKDKQSADKVFHWLNKTGCKDVTVDGNQARLVVDENVSIDEMREKYSKCPGHELLIMPELTKKATVEIDERWLEVLKDSNFNLKSVCKDKNVKVDTISNSVCLIGKLEQIDLIKTLIFEHIQRNLEIRPSERNFAASSVKHNGIDGDFDDSYTNGASNNSEMVGSSQTTVSPPHRLTSYTDYTETAAFGKDGNGVLAEVGNQSKIGSKTGATNYDTESPRSLPLKDGKNGHFNKHFASPETSNRKADEEGLELGNRTLSDSEDEQASAAGIFNLELHQMQFIRKYYPDLYKELKRYPELGPDSKNETYRTILSQMKKLKIGELERFPLKDDTIGVVSSLLKELAEVKLTVESPAGSDALEVIGLPYDIFQLQKKLDEYMKAHAKYLQSNLFLELYQFTFIKNQYPEIYEHINGLQTKASNGQVQISGSPDEMNALSSWIRKHDIKQVERRVEQLPTRISVELFKALKDYMQAQMKICVELASGRMYEMIGFSSDIRKFTTELALRDKRAILSKTNSLNSYGQEASSSDKEFEFRTPLSSIKVVVARGDLTKERTDAIVNPTNHLLKHQGGAAKAIADAAGRKLIDDCEKILREKGSLKVSDVVHSKSGQLYPPIKYVLHANGPMASLYRDMRKCQAVLEKTFLNCFILANDLRLESLSVPAVSSGISGVSKDIVALSSWNALMSFDEKLAATSTGVKSLKYLRFINIDFEATDCLIQTFKRCWDKYLSDKKLKAGAACAEPSSRRASGLRRSGSYSGTYSGLISNDKFKEVKSSKDDMASLARDKRFLPESNSVDLKSQSVVPQIKNTSAHSGSTSEARCCVCSKLKKSTYLMRRDCPHKCCALCLQGKCIQCTKSTKFDSGPILSRNSKQSSPGKEESVIRNVPESPETESEGKEKPRTERRRSFSLGNWVDKRDEDEGSGSKTSSGFMSSATQSQQPNKDEDCCICMDTIKNAKRLDCGHVFCKDCIDKAFQHQPKCPSCGQLFGLPKGNQPFGTMTIKRERFPDLEGYRGHGVIVIQYCIPDGIQTVDHPNPGKRYKGTVREAYLPGNAEGEEVCKLLQKAFDAKLIFTIGKSNTTGQDNVVVWNDIHHKTKRNGSYGYPDPDYLSRVRDELAAKGIKSSHVSSVPLISTTGNIPVPNPAGFSSSFKSGSNYDSQRYNHDHGAFASLPVEVGSSATSEAQLYSSPYVAAALLSSINNHTDSSPRRMASYSYSLNSAAGSSVTTKYDTSNSWNRTSGSQYYKRPN